ASVRTSIPPAPVRDAAPSKTLHSRPSGLRRNTPRYPSREVLASPFELGGMAPQSFCRRLTTASDTSQVGSRRPEKMRAPAIHFSGNFDVAMHHDHKCAEVRIRASIRGARIGNQVAAVVDVRRRSTARFVGPVAVTTFAIPMEIPS